MTLSSEFVFDPADPKLRRDPYPTYGRMRERASAWRAADGIWYFTRYRDCCAIFGNPALSHDNTASVAYRSGLSTDQFVRAEQLEEIHRNRTMQHLDPPDHTRVRSLVNRAFTAPTVESSLPVIEDYVDELIGALGGPSVDLVSEFSLMLPVYVISRMLNISLEERHEFREVGDSVGRSIDPDVPLDGKLAANKRLREYIARLVAMRRETPGSDLMSRLIDATGDGRLASEDELVINTGLLLIAGFETTTNLISNAVYRLLQFPDQLALLRADHSLIRTTVEEVLRFDPPSQFVRPKTVLSATVIGGIELCPGDAAVPLLAAANRDPDEFPDPESFDVRRKPNRHLSFGLGQHLCLGAALARAEAQIAVLRLVDRFPNLALAADDEPQYRPNLQLRGFARLPVTL